jgi:pimeloyl-ACP methyl ester carboxylesterase
MARTDPVDTPVPFIEVGGSGRALLFLHANGYPPRCYQPLLDRFSKRYRTLAMILRPLWPGSRPEDIRDWEPLSNDLLRFMDQQKLDGVFAVGHSVGAIVVLRAALRAPDRFGALVLLEPVLMPRDVMAVWWLARALGFGKWLHPMIRGALTRRRSFDNLNQVYDGYRRRRIFRYLSDEGLRQFIRGMTTPTAARTYDLVYNPEWEARVYDTGIWHDWDLWKELPRLRAPTLIVRGAETDTFRDSASRTVKRKNPAIKIVTLINSTHLVPLEQPQAVFEAIDGFLQNVRPNPLWRPFGDRPARTA